MPLYPLLLCLLCQDPSISDLVVQLSAGELEARAVAEARLKAVDPVHARELQGFRDECRDIEARARLDGIVLRLRYRQSQRHYEEANLPESLRVLAEIERGEGQDPSASGRVEWAERRLKDLLRERSPEFSADGDVLAPTSWESLAPQIEPLLPWIYPALVRGLAPGSRGHGNAVFILTKLGDRAAPALRWALKTSTPGAQIQACSILARIGEAPRVVDALGEAARSPDGEVRRHARLALLKVR